MNYKPLFTFLFILALFPACRSKVGSGSERSYSRAYKEAFVEGFKTLTFCKCVDYGNSSIEELAQEDASCRFPDYLYMEGEVIDSLARVEVNIIKIDSASRAGRVAEGMEGKRVVANCLDFYKSDRLDSIAKARFKLNEQATKSSLQN